MHFAITGIGLYNGLGKDAVTSFYALLEGKSTIVPISWPEYDDQLFPQSHKAVPTTLVGNDPTTVNSSIHFSITLQCFNKWFNNNSSSTFTHHKTITRFIERSTDTCRTQSSK